MCKRESPILNKIGFLNDNVKNLFFDNKDVVRPFVYVSQVNHKFKIGIGGTGISEDSSLGGRFRKVAAELDPGNFVRICHIKQYDDIADAKSWEEFAQQHLGLHQRDYFYLKKNIKVEDFIKDLTKEVGKLRGLNKWFDVDNLMSSIDKSVNLKNKMILDSVYNVDRAITIGPTYYYIMVKLNSEYAKVGKTDKKSLKRPMQIINSQPPSNITYKTYFFNKEDVKNVFNIKTDILSEKDIENELRKFISNMDTFTEEHTEWLSGVDADKLIEYIESKKTNV
jgi:hypothetical protein